MQRTVHKNSGKLQLKRLCSCIHGYILWPWPTDGHCGHFIVT